jgi:hypothetical protein
MTQWFSSSNSYGVAGSGICLTQTAMFMALPLLCGRSPDDTDCE